MELLTDILAIAGWGLFGFFLPFYLILFRSGVDAFFSEKSPEIYWTLSALSFGLIAASLVLG